MDQAKILKQNIEKIIEKGDLHNAELLINSYGNVYKKDADFYSIKSVVLILKGDFDEAERILCKAVLERQLNCDIVHNLIYTLESVGKLEKSFEYKILQDLLTCGAYMPYGNHVKTLKHTNNIVMGTMEIANQMNIQAMALKKLNYHTTTLNYYDSYLKYKSDFVLDPKELVNYENANLYIKSHVAPIIKDNDIFHFHFGTTLTLDHSDLPVLNKLGKKTIMQYWGSDVRMVSIAKKNNPYSKVKETNEDSIKRKLEHLSKYISNCFVDYELAEYVKDYHEKVHVTKSSIDLSKFSYTKFEKNDNDKLIIAHAPTAPEFKGTKFIVEAIESLKTNYNIEFKLITGLSNDQAIEEYKKADIIVDQLHMGTYGVFAVEAMALRKPVVCWISDYMRELLPKDLPIIIANPDTIKSVLKNLFDNRDQLSLIGKKSREFVEKYHDSNIVAKNHETIYKSL